MNRTHQLTDMRGYTPHVPYAWIRAHSTTEPTGSAAHPVALAAVAPSFPAFRATGRATIAPIFPARSVPRVIAHAMALAAAALLMLTFAAVAPAASDYQWTFNSSGNFDYRLTAVSSPKVYSGSLSPGPLDPTLNLIQGARYGVTNLNPTAHPLQVLAKGSTSGTDIVLLSEGFILGTMEGDAGINWTDDGQGHMEFTVTPDLVAAMRQSGHNPGYRCAIHVTTMRGNFTIYGDGTKIEDPLPDIQKGDVTIELQPVATGLIAPLGLVEPNDGSGRLFIYDQAGFVYVLEDGIVYPEPFLDVTSRLVSLGVRGEGSYDERGLIGFAIHPDFAHNGKVFTYTCEPAGSGTADFTTVVPVPGDMNNQSVISEWQVEPNDDDRIDPATRRELLRIDQPQFNHEGGTLRFGPDGYLYISLGDGGRADDQGDGHVPDGNAQDVTSIYGNLVRIDVGGSNSPNGQYGIPPDNPFVGTNGLDEIFAFGFRNPYAFSFDLLTGAIWLGDAGQNDIEEVDIVAKGGNYGWRLKEGSFFFDPNGEDDGFVTTEPVEPLPPDLIDPVAEYDHDEGTVVVSGFVYRGSTIPELQGRFVTGDFGQFQGPTGRLFYIDDQNQFKEFTIGETDRPLGVWLKGFGQDLNGEVYVCGSTDIGPFGSSGQVLKLVPLPAPPPPDPESHVFDFGVTPENWTFVSTAAFDAPTAYIQPGDPGQLVLESPNSANAFGYWESPELTISTDGADANTLFAAEFTVRSTVADTARVPQLRMRVTNAELEQSAYLLIDGRDDGESAPTSQGNSYHLGFPSYIATEEFLVEFEMLNFNPQDATDGDLRLDSVEVERYDGVLANPQTVKTYTFDAGSEGWTSAAAVPFTTPLFSNPAGALAIQGQTGDTNTFGFWTSPAGDVTLAPDLLYLITFDVGSDVAAANRDQVPQVRVRVNDASFHAAAYVAVESKGEADVSPVDGAPQQYTVYFLPTSAAVGQPLLASFDFLNFDPQDRADATLQLNGVTIQTVPSPFGS